MVNQRDPRPNSPGDGATGPLVGRSFNGSLVRCLAFPGSVAWLAKVVSKSSGCTSSAHELSGGKGFGHAELDQRAFAKRERVGRLRGPGIKGGQPIQSLLWTRGGV